MRGVGATQLEMVLSTEENGAFTLKATWNGGSHEKLFSKAYVFGPTLHGDPMAYAVQQRTCDYARDFMREVLQLRGAV